MIPVSLAGGREGFALLGKTRARTLVVKVGQANGRRARRPWLARPPPVQDRVALSAATDQYPFFPVATSPAFMSRVIMNPFVPLNS